MPPKQKCEISSVSGRRFRYKPSVLYGRLVIVSAFFRALGEIDFTLRQRFVRDLTKQVRNAMEPCSLFVVRAQDIPGRELRICGLEHFVSGSRIVVPTLARGQVHWAQLPLAHRVLYSGQETALLFFIAYFQPVFD